MDVIAAAWRNSTKKQYMSHIKKWEVFCRQSKISYHTANISNVLEFLAGLHFDEHLSYSAINSARSALSSYLGQISDRDSIGSHPLISRFMKGILIKILPSPDIQKFGMLALFSLCLGNGLQLQWQRLTFKVVM